MDHGYSDSLGSDARQFRAFVEEGIVKIARAFGERREGGTEVKGPFPLRLNLRLGELEFPAWRSSIAAVEGSVRFDFGLIEDFDELNWTQTALYVRISWANYRFENVISIRSRKHALKFIFPYVEALLLGRFRILKPSKLRRAYLILNGQVPPKSDCYVLSVVNVNFQPLVTQVLTPQDCDWGRVT